MLTEMPRCQVADSKLTHAPKISYLKVFS